MQKPLQRTALFIPPGPPKITVRSDLFAAFKSDRDPDMPSAVRELLTVASSMGRADITLVVGFVSSIVGAIVGAAIYVTRMGSQAKIDSLEGKVDWLKTTIEENLARAEKERTERDEKHQAILAEANEKYAELDDKYQAILRGGALIQIQLQEIIERAEEIARRLGANDYAVLVPAPTDIPGDTPNQLVFLCASGAQAAKLRWVRVPIENSLCGEVYQSGKTRIASPPPSGGAFASRVDKITEYKTDEALSVCLRHGSLRVGVAQFLNKDNKQQFDPDNDNERAEMECRALAPLVASFLADPRRLIEMGHAPRRNRIDATIMLVDLSHYEGLFDELDSSVITDLLNEYFQELCTIALNYGGVIDQFVGDGVLLTFNVFQRQDAHQETAFAAAVAMRKAFRNLRERWKTLGYTKTAALLVRIGLSCGPVTRAEVGHPHARRITVIGPAVNAAADACESGSRDRDIIVLTLTIKETLANASKLDGLEVNKENEVFFVLG